MTALLRVVMIALLGHACAGGASEPAQELELELSSHIIVRGTTAKSFSDVMQELEFAITEHNLRITGRNAIGQGLRDRGYQDFPEMEIIHFCSLESAREVLLLDPGYIAMMPCRVTVHEGGGKTIVSLILLPEQHPDARVVAFAQRINRSLREILDFVLEKNSQ